MTKTKRSDRRSVYVSTTISVVDGIANQAYDLRAALDAKGGWNGARYLKIASTLTITMRVNSTAADQITIGTTAIVLDDILTINDLYFTHAGGASGTGNATVTLLAI